MRWAHKVIFSFALALLSLGVVLSFANRRAESSHRANDDASFILTPLKECLRDIGLKECAHRVARFLLERYSLREILDVLEEKRDQQEVFLICHQYQFTRDLGYLEQQRTNDLQNTLAQCNGSCYEGCYHGAAEARVAEILPSSEQGKNSAETTAHLSLICGRIGDYAARDLFMGCLHGLGRGLMQAYANNLPFALRICDHFASEFEREGCESGVFMENYTSDHRSRFIEPDNPTYPCTIVDERHKKTCYAFQGRFVLDSSNLDFAKAVAFCASIPRNYEQECITQISGHLVYTKDGKELSDACEAFSDDDKKKLCIVSIARYLLQRDFGSNWGLDHFCATLAIPYRYLCLPQKNNGIGNAHESQ